MIEPIIHYIKTNWNTKQTYPNDFNSILDALEEQNENKIDELKIKSDSSISSYEGLNNDEPGFASCSIERRLSPWYISYGKYDQGEDPIDVLIYTLINFGMDLQKNFNRVRRIDESENFVKETTEKCKQRIILKINEVIIKICMDNKDNTNLLDKLNLIFKMINLLNADVLNINVENMFKEK